jgi:hypothetical protein
MAQSPAYKLLPTGPSVSLLLLPRVDSLPPAMFPSLPTPLAVRQVLADSSLLTAQRTWLQLRLWIDPPDVCKPSSHSVTFETTYYSLLASSLSIFLRPLPNQFSFTANPTAPIARSTMSRLLLEHALSPRSVALLSNSQSPVLSIASSRCLLVARLVSLLELRSEFLSAVAFALDAQNQRVSAPTGTAAAPAASGNNNNATAAATAVLGDEAVAAFSEPPLMR